MMIHIFLVLLLPFEERRKWAPAGYIASASEAASCPVYKCLCGHFTPVCRCLRSVHGARSVRQVLHAARHNQRIEYTITVCYTFPAPSLQHRREAWRSRDPNRQHIHDSHWSVGGLATALLVNSIDCRGATQLLRKAPGYAFKALVSAAYFFPLKWKGSVFLFHENIHFCSL